jgi:hypothetical protein
MVHLKFSSGTFDKSNSLNSSGPRCFLESEIRLASCYLREQNELSLRSQFAADDWGGLERCTIDSVYRRGEQHVLRPS